MRVDTIPEIITKKDMAAHELLKQFNSALEDHINSIIENSLSRDIALLVSENVSETIYDIRNPLYDALFQDRFRRVYDFTYDNYMYGQKAANISDVSQCSIMRGSESRPGESALVEANR